MGNKTAYTFQSTIIKDESVLYSLHFLVPDEIVQTIKSDGHKRLRVSVNKEDAIAAALLSKGNGVYAIKLNKGLLKKWKLQLGDSVDVVAVPDESKYGMDLPEEFAAIWEVDQQGSDYFHALTPGKQRTLLHLVAKVKSPDIRAKKAMIIMEYLNLNEGKLDFKALNEAMKG